MPELENDWMVLSTINAPRREWVNGDDVESWLRDTTVQQDTMGLQPFSMSVTWAHNWDF